MPAIVILAAGASTRLGQPKQLLPFGGSTLLQHTIDTALATDVEVVLLVLGANAATILNGINTVGLEVVINGEWHSGMASSVRLGVSTLQQSYPHLEQVIFLLCDQPFVTSTLLSQLVAAQVQSGKKIAACHYHHTAGVPVLFVRSLFPQLMQLQGDEGARKLLMVLQEDLITIPFPEGETDIDNRADYDRLVATRSR